MKTQLVFRRVALRAWFALSAALLLVLPCTVAQSRVRTELFFPDLPGYRTLRCDFHSHTVFSDGQVWPTLRIEEAWRDGLDAIAISDHIEYQPHRVDVSTNLLRSTELAGPLARSLGIVLIPALEITRGEPPGHWNALFVTNTTGLRHTNHFEVVTAVVNQGAFVFWNHPGWKQPGGKSVWYPDQETVFKLGQLHGLEIVNGDTYDPIAHQWCVEKQLTPVGNSDVHGPIHWEYHSDRGPLRPLTLVFARERTLEGIREALFARRTVVVANQSLYGAGQFLRPLFDASLELKNPKIELRGKGSALLQVFNRSAISYQLESEEPLPEVSLPGKVTLTAGKTSLLEVRSRGTAPLGARVLRLPFRVANLHSSPDTTFPVTLEITADFSP